jgi:uncharacterized protein YjbI with pentapeptide repeats
MRPRLRAIVALILLAAPASAPAQTAPLPILPCRIAADHSWTPQEQVAWARICGDQVANFNDEPDYGGAIDLRDGWLPDNRVLSRKFIETILTDEKYRGAIKRHGVRFAGARFTQPIDLQNVKLDNELWFDQCLFDAEVDMSWLQAAQPVGFSGSTVTGPLIFYAAQLASDLQIKGSVVSEIRMAGAHVGRTLDLGGSNIIKELDMRGIDVGVDLGMASGEYKNVSLLGAHVGHTLNLQRSTVVGLLQMDSLQVGVYLHFRYATLADVDLLGAHVQSQVAFQGATVTGTLNMFETQVGTDLFMNNGATFSKAINLRNAQIGGGLDWRGATFHGDVDLTGAHVSGAFALGSQNQPAAANQPGPAKWAKGVTLTARYAKVGVLPRLSDAWPDKLHVVGLTYDGIDAVGEEFQPWFDRQDHYSRQPYEYLANGLQAQGDIERATAVRYAERERDRGEQSSWIFAWLTLLKHLIGYGYYPQYSLYWVGGFVLLGMAVLWISGEGRRNHMPYGVSYSFDMLLPIIQLRAEHYTIDLAGWARYYFYIHKIAGWALAAFLAAGLAGLTK